MRSAGRLIPLVLVFCMVAVASAQDAQLTALHATLEALHERATEIAAQDRMIPELTVAKHQLRDWVESKLESLNENDPDKVKALEETINQELRSVGMPGAADDQNPLGSLDEVRFDGQSGMLIVTTGVGIICEVDQPAYGYKRIG
jgi:hypothetical protein